MQQKLKVVFMGTPEFAVATLQAIEESQHQVVAVVTVPDKPAGRGQKLAQSAVKQYAETLNIPILQPEKLKNKSFIKSLKTLQADIFVVVAFRILPKEVYTIPVQGTFNLHASLLPQLRGAAPINFAIINGETETGVTTFFLNEKVDTGEIILQEKVQIEPNDTAGILHDKLMIIGKDVVVKTLDAIANKSFTAKPQKQIDNLGYAPKIDKEICNVNWKKSPIEIHNLIRGMSPYPGAFTHIYIDEQPKMLKIYAGVIFPEKPNVPKFTIEITKNSFRIALEDVWYTLVEVQPEGKKRMQIKEFINGLQQKTVRLVQ